MHHLPLALSSFLLIGCPASRDETARNGDTDLFEVTAELNDNSTLIVDVSWTAPEFGTSWVEYGYDESLGQKTPPVEGDGELLFHLYGLTPDTEVYYKAIMQTESREWTETGSILTGPPPELFPAMSVEVIDEAAMADQPYLIGNCTTDRLPFFAIDRTGAAVWYLFLPDFTLETAYADSIQLLDNERVLLAIGDSAAAAEGHSIYRQSLAGGALDYVTEDPANAYHHSAIQIPDGSTAWLSTLRKPWVDPNGTTWDVMGDVILEISPEGVQRQVFSTWDWREPIIHDYWEVSGQPGVGDWTHANSLYYREETDSYVISLGFVSAVLEVDRSSGAVLAEYGSGYAIPVAEGDQEFFLQHDASFTPEGHLLMAARTPDTSQCFVIEYEVDEAAGVLREVWSFGMGLNLVSKAGGTAWRFENGNTLWGTGNAGYFFEITPEGEIVWQAQMNVGDRPFCELHPISTFYEGM